MSAISMEEKLNSSERNNAQKIFKKNNKRRNEDSEEEEEVLIQYKNMPHDLNNISLKARFTCQKMIELMDNNNKEEELSLDELNDPKRAETFKKKLAKKLIQHYCMENAEKNKYKSPSEKTMNKLKQFKKWQNYEIFQKNGIKNYLNNILPDFRLIYKTNFLINDKINLFTKLKIKKNPDKILLPKISITNQKINNLKENELFNNKSQSCISSGEKNICKKRLVASKSLDEFKINSSTISKMLNQNSLKSKIKNRKINFLSNNQPKFSINLLKIQKSSLNNKSAFNIEEGKKNFEDSTFCYSNMNVPLSVNKSVTSSPYGGCLFFNNSILRNKNMNDLVNSSSQSNILEKLEEYKSKRNQIISGKDYLQHIGKTFITLNKQLTNYDYNIF